MSEDGPEIARADATVQPIPREARAALPAGQAIGLGFVFNLAGLVFPSYGRYHFALRWDGNQMREPVGLRVAEMQPGALPGLRGGPPLAQQHRGAWAECGTPTTPDNACWRVASHSRRWSRLCAALTPLILTATETRASWLTSTDGRSRSWSRCRSFVCYYHHGRNLGGVMPARAEYDSDTGAMYIYLSDDAIARTEDREAQAYAVDLAEDGSVVGIEVLNLARAPGLERLAAEWGFGDQLLEATAAMREAMPVPPAFTASAAAKIPTLTSMVITPSSMFGALPIGGGVMVASQSVSMADPALQQREPEPV